MDYNNLLIQSLAIIALGLFAISYHAKARWKILLFQAIALLFWITHFLLLSAWTGASMNIINIFVITLLIFKTKKKWIRSNITLYSIILVFIIATIITWQGYYSIFALLGIIFMTIARWQDKTINIRYLALLGGLLWIIYDLFAGAYGSVIAELVIGTSIIISIYRNK
ncbi:MAG: YgjV family protein [Nanoarchaeota archaeon]